jgi:hypothetical protein
MPAKQPPAGPAAIAAAGDIRDAALGMFANAEVARTERGFADEKILALTLLARTVSNVKGALLLLDAKRIVQARTITRCAFENLYWIVGLAEEGEAFVREDASTAPHGDLRSSARAQLNLDVREGALTLRITALVISGPSAETSKS